MARKLKLDLETLSVESFDVARAEGKRGTVLGRSYNPTDPTYNSYDNCGFTEPGSDSYGENTCGWTCSFDCQDMSMGGSGGSGSFTSLEENDYGMGGFTC